MVIAGLAGEQHGLVTAAQLLDRGVTRAMIESRLRTAGLHRVHAGVYAVGTPPTTREAHWLAAVLACGPGALLSHASAAALWGVRPTSQTRIDVAQVGGSGRARAGIRGHRLTRLIEADRAIRDGIPVTSLPRTIIDLATVVPRGALEYAIHRGESRELVTPDEIRAALERLRGHPGTAAVRAIVGAPHHDLDARTKGRRERRMLAICRHAGVPAPLVNHWIALPIAAGGLEVDFCWPEHGLIVEVDEHATHRTTRAFRNDRARDRALVEAGWRVIRFAEDDLADAGAVARDLRGGLGAGRPGVSTRSATEN